MYIITALIWIVMSFFYVVLTALKNVRDPAAQSVRVLSAYVPISKGMGALNRFGSGIIMGM